MPKSRNSNKICNHCKKKGHIKECFTLQNMEKKFRNKQGEKYGKYGKASVVGSNQCDGDLLVACDAHSRASENWILDSGCTFHMTPTQDWFSTNEPVHKRCSFDG